MSLAGGGIEGKSVPGMRNVLRAVLKASQDAKERNEGERVSTMEKLKSTSEELAESQRQLKEEQQVRLTLERRVEELERKLEKTQSSRAQEMDAARNGAKELFDRLQAAEQAFQELWEDMSVVLAQQQGTPLELKCLEAHDEVPSEEVEAAILKQLPTESPVEDQLAACVTLAAKLQQLRAQESELAQTEITTLGARCARHEVYLDMLDRTKKLQPEFSVPNRGSRDMLVAKIAQCLSRGYSVKEGTQSEIQHLRRQLKLTEET